MEINDERNKEKIAIVVVGYNRLKSIKRLLGSLSQAHYPNNEIPLVISIDCSGDTELYDYVQNFEWQFGEKYLIIQEKRLGLKEHIYQCGDLTKYFKAIILLEDDIYVSRVFYPYVCQTLDKYESDDKIASIALYKPEMNGYIWLPFDHLQNGSDVFAFQAVSTWGECWTESMWNGFRSWLRNNENIDFKSIDMPEQIKKWNRSWSKYFNAYLINCNKYSICPYISLTTNFSDAGVHGGDNNTIVQVNLLYGEKVYNLFDFENLVCYDIYGNNADLAKELGLDKKDLCTDLYGINPNNLNKKYVLSISSLPYESIRSFALNLRPQELNVIYNLSGNDIHLYDTTQPKFVFLKSRINSKYLFYHLRGFSIKYLFVACCHSIFLILRKVKHKLK